MPEILAGPCRSAAQQLKDGGCLSPTSRGGAGKPATPQGEIHLQVNCHSICVVNVLAFSSVML